LIFPYDGVEAARTIKTNSMTAHIPIIACSAFSKSEERKETLRAGMVGYLQKPIPSA
jgi:CheY-like chemotaxis protein